MRQRWLRWTPDERRAFLTRLDPQERERLLELLENDTEDDGAPRLPWEQEARPEQIAPPGDWFVWLILAGRGWGKLLDVATPIPTPSGWAKLSDINAGSEVFDEAGRVCRVTRTFDAVPDVAYRVHFSDGTHVDACADHQWVTWTHAERKVFLRSPYEDSSRFPAEWPQWRLKRMLGRYLSREVVEQALTLHGQGRSARSIAAELGVDRSSLAQHLAAGHFVPREPVIHDDAPGPQIRTTQQIADTVTFGSRGDLNHCIPTCGPLQMPEADLPIDPYILGMWLGDGHTAGAALTCADEPILDELRRRGVRITPYREHERTRGYGMAMADGRSLRVMLRDAGVLGNKHVPAAYLRASVTQRLDLLQGLMDSDGYAEASKAEFCNTNRALIDAVTELARSLGQKPVVYTERAALNGVDCGPRWRVTWRPTVPVFRLPRKAEKTGYSGAQSLRNHHRMITRVERIDPVPMRCLTVDGPNSMFLAGEGMIPTHNTRTAAEWAANRARRYPRCRFALVAATFADARDTMVEGESGLLACFDDDELRGGSRDGAWNRSLGELYLANGSRFKTFSSEKPWKLRGPQFHFAWGDESAFWADAADGVAADTTWSNLVIATRLPARPGWDDEYRTQVCVATTPRPVALLRTHDPDPAKAGLMQRASTILTRGRTADNLANLSETYKAQVIAPLEGTRLGRQELDAEILEGSEGALWSQDLLDEIQVSEVPGSSPGLHGFRRACIGVDPSDGQGASDEQAYTVCGLAGDGHLYVPESWGDKIGPVPFLRKVVDAAQRWDATIILEKNHGGAYLVATLRQVMKDMGVSVPYHVVHASQSKRTRAEPVAALYERGVIRHVNGPHVELESQMVTFTGAAGERSPDRLDSLCWSVQPFLEVTFGPQPVRAPGPRQWAGSADLARIGRPPTSRRDPRALDRDRPDPADAWDADSFAPQADVPRRRGNVRSWR